MNNIIKTKRHKIRLFFGIDGLIPERGYCFKIPKWTPEKLKRPFYKFMHYFGNPLLNFLIGYKPLDWKLQNQEEKKLYE